MSVTLIRPNGKPYRPQLPPSVVEYVDTDECTCVAVLRTHDVKAAEKLAAGWIEEFELNPAHATTDWWRLVPYDTGSGYDRNWVTDPVRGVPCVVFPHEWERTTTPTPGHLAGTNRPEETDRG